MQLSPSQRLTLLKEIASRLAVEEWPLLDTTLKAYQLPVSDRWDGGKHAYVLEMVAEASDQVLIDLAHHFWFDYVDFVFPSTQVACWGNGTLRLFISHLAKERQLAADLKNSFLKFEISSFVAHNDIEPTKEWQDEIEGALASCDVLVALLHPDFHASNWTDQEIGFAMGRGVPTFAVRLGKDPYGFIGRFQAFNGIGKSAESLAREIFKACLKKKTLQSKLAESLVRLFENSGSFAQSRERIGYLEELEVWDKSFSERIENAVKANFQIRESYRVKERVKALVQKWSMVPA
jgi:TIR domain